MNFRIPMLLCIVIFMLPACTMVELTAEGEKARVLTPDEVTKCTFVGKTTSTTTAKLLGAGRNEKAINDELLTLARNSAKNLGGDTVVTEGEVKDGQQTFRVYRCVPK